jgi:small subunit ribosomal protein S15
MEKNKQIHTIALHDKDTGSVELQVVALTTRINELSGHFKSHSKDFSSRRGLLAMINRRKKFLLYLKGKKKDVYTKLIENLGLRR